MTIRQRRVVTAAALDVASLLLFVVIGRRNHEEGESVAGIVETAAPFLIGLAVAWLVVRAWRWPTALLTGLALWPITVLPTCGILRRLPSTVVYPKPSHPTRAPEWSTTSSPSAVPG